MANDIFDLSFEEEKENNLDDSIFNLDKFGDNNIDQPQQKPLSEYMPEGSGKTIFDININPMQVLEGVYDKINQAEAKTNQTSSAASNYLSGSKIQEIKQPKTSYSNMPAQQNLTEPKKTEKSFEERNNIFNNPEYQKKSLIDKAGTIATNILNTVAGSGASLGAGVASAGDMLVDLSMQRDIQTPMEDYAEKSQQFAQERFDAGSWNDNLNVMESLKEGNIGEAISKGVQGALQNSAQLATITTMGILTGGVSNTAASGLLNSTGAITQAAMQNAPLALIGASAGGGQYASLDDREDLSINQKVTSGLTATAIESATETYGSLNWLDDIMKSTPGARGQVIDSVFDIARRSIDPKKVAINAGEEALEEITAGFSNEIANSIMGINDKSLPEVIMNYEEYLNQGIIGGLSGAGMSIGAQIANTVMTPTQQQEGQPTEEIDLSSQISQKYGLPKETVDKIQSDINQILNSDPSEILQDSEMDEDNGIITTYKPDEQQPTEQVNMEPQQEDELIDLSNTSQNQLLTVPGIGSTLSNNIMEYINENGIETVDELANVNGVGQATLDKIRGKFTVGETVAEETTEQEVEQPVEETIEDQTEETTEEVEGEGVIQLDGETQPTEQSNIISGVRYDDNDKETIINFADSTRGVYIQTNEEGSEIQDSQYQNWGTNAHKLNIKPQKPLVVNRYSRENGVIPGRGTPAGIQAARILLDEKTWRKIWNMNSSELNNYLSENYPEVSREIENNPDMSIQPLEILGAHLARQEGYDSIITSDENISDPSEALVLDSNIIEDYTFETEQPVEPQQELTVDEIDDQIDDLFFELEQAETETKQYEIRQQIDQLEQQRSEMIDNQESVAEENDNITTVYRGKGRENKGDIYNWIERPILGEENYFAFDESTAQKYGSEVEQVQVDTSNFLEINNDSQWRNITEKAGVNYPSPYGMNEQQLDNWINQVKSEIKNEGYDGVSIRLDNTDNTKLLSDVFGDEQIISFNDNNIQQNESTQKTDVEETETTQEVEDTTETETQALNLNSATIDDLTEINGIGASTAQNIINYRDSLENGIESVDELKQVKGIGSATFDKIAPLFTVEVVDSTDTTDTIEEPTDSDITANEGVKTEAENLDADKIASEVDDVEGSIETTNELLSEEARDLMEFEDKDIREILDVVYFTTLDELQNLPQGEREQFLDDVKTESPDVADAIRAELEEREYEGIGGTMYSRSGGDQERLSGVNVGDGRSDSTINYATRKGIEDTIRVGLKLPLRFGEISSRKAEAQYDTLREVVRTRDYSNLEVTAHEVGHHLSKKYNLNVKNFDELPQLLAQEGLADRYDSSLHHEEGAAEFFKYYFNEPGTANLKAPQFYDYVESKLESNPELYEQVKSLQKQMTRWHEQSAVDRGSGTMTRESAKNPELLNLRQKIARAFIDANIGLKAALEQAGVNPDELDVSDNPIKLMRLLNSVNDKVNTFLTKKQLDPVTGLPNGKSLQEILKPVEDFIGKTADGREFGDFEVYALGRHAIEREAMYIAKKIGKDTEIGRMIQELISENDIAGMERIIRIHGDRTGAATGMRTDDIVNIINNLETPQFKETLSELVDYQNNLIDYLQHRDMLSAEQAQNIKDSYNFHIPLYRMFGEDVSGNYSGGGKSIVDLPNPIKSAYGSTRVIEDPLRSIVKNTAYTIKQADKNEIAVKLIEAIADKEGTGTLVGKELSKDVVPHSFDLEQIKDDLMEAGLQESDIENLDLEQMATVFETQHYKLMNSKENVITYRKNGKMVAREVHPDLYEILNGVDNKLADNADNIIQKFLKYPNSLFKQFAVIDPSFWLRNFIRDPGRHLIYGGNSDGYKVIGSVMDGMSDALGMSKKEIEAMFYGSGGARAGFAEFLKDIDSPDTVEQLLNADTPSKNPITFLLNRLSGTSKWTEDVRRRGYFVEFLENHNFEEMTDEEIGEAVKEAALEARGGVLEDYGIKGNLTKKMDNYFGFTSAGVTGARHFFEKMKDPMNFLRGLIYLTLPQIFLWLKNKDEPAYQELSLMTKAFYFININDDGEVQKLIKPFLPGYIFASLPEIMLNYMNDIDETRLSDALWQLFKVGAPSMEPSGYIPYIEIMVNKRFGDRGEIVPQSEQNLPKEDQFGTNTSELAKILGQITNQSPRKIDHWIRGQFTSVGGSVTDIVEYVAGAQDFKETTLSIMGLYNDPFSTSTTVNKLYEDREKYLGIISDARNKYMTGQQIPYERNQLGEAAGRYSAINRITRQMSKRRQASEIIRSYDNVPRDLREQASLYLNIQNINDARRYYGKDKIDITKYLTEEEYYQIQSLINSIGQRR